MEVSYFARWLWTEGRGLEPLSARRLASIDSKGRTFVAYLPEERLALTIRRETTFVDLGFLSATGERLGGVALILGSPKRIESIDVWQHGEEVVRLQGGDDDTLTVTTAPFREPTEFAIRNIPDVAFPSIGDYGALAELPRNPWDYVELPNGFTPPKPAP